MQRSPKINGNMLQHWLLRSFYLILLNKPNELYECAHIHHMCRTCVYIQKNRESAVICVKCNSQFESHCIQSQSRPSFGHLVWNSVDFQSMIIFTGWKVNLGNMSTVARFIYLSIDRKTTTSRNWSQILKVSLMTIKKASKYGIFLLGNWKIDEENFARAFKCDPCTIFDVHMEMGDEKPGAARWIENSESKTTKPPKCLLFFCFSKWKMSMEKISSSHDHNVRTYEPVLIYAYEK